jgi:hypothetical protein
MKYLKSLFILLLLVSVSTFANDYFFLQSDNGTNTYIKNTNPFFTQDRIARLENATEVTETNVIAIPKPSWVITAESMYTNNLVQIGADGAWTNMAVTFEDIGMMLLVQIDQTNDVAVSNFAAKKKSILESLYVTLNSYAKAYGITDMRKYPFGEQTIKNTITTNTYIMFETYKYYYKVSNE